MSKTKAKNMLDKPMVTSHEDGRATRVTALQQKCPLCVDLQAQVKLRQLKFMNIVTTIILVIDNITRKE